MNACVEQGCGVKCSDFSKSWFFFCCLIANKETAGAYQTRSRVKYFFLFNTNPHNTGSTSMTAKPYGSGGEMKAFSWEWCLRKQEGDYKRWSAWATGKDGRWVSTVALKRQNVACSSDRCSLISAACQHFEWRTVVVFERDPGLVPFGQSQSFSEQNKSRIYIDLTSNHIHRTDVCLKIQDKWGSTEKLLLLQQKSQFFFQGLRSQRAAVLTILSTGHF